MQKFQPLSTFITISILQLNFIAISVIVIILSLSLRTPTPGKSADAHWKRRISMHVCGFECVRNCWV